MGIPMRGIGTLGCFGVLGMGAFIAWIHAPQTKRLTNMIDNENKTMMAIWKPLLHAERARMVIQRKKEYLEQLNMNLVHTGIFPNLKPAQDWSGKYAYWKEWGDKPLRTAKYATFLLNMLETPGFWAW